MDFRVKLESVNLSKPAMARIHAGIQHLVVAELAAIDHIGDLSVTQSNE